jgi:iron complex outermembrane receptor protein
MSIFYRVRRVRYALVAFACFSSSFAWAQVPEIVVTSNPFQAKELSTPVERLSGDALVLRQAGSLGETLSGLAGVSSTYFGGTASRPVIRGLDGDRIRILSNGAASSDVSGLSFDHAVADSPLAAESIEIVRGPAALIYGGAAVGGVVNMLDNRIAKNAQFDDKGGLLGKVQLGLGAGSQERQTAALLETGTDKYALHLDVFSRKANEASVPTGLSCKQNGVTRVQNKLCNSQAEAAGGALGGSLLFANGHLGASIQNTKQHYGSAVEDEVTLKMNSLRFKIEGEQRDLSALGGLVKEISGHLVRHNYQHQEFDAGILGTTFKNQGQEAKLQARLRSGEFAAGKLETALGVAQERIDFVANGTEAYVPITQTRTQSLYAVQELTHRIGKLTAGVRRDQTQVDSKGLDSKPIFVPAQRSLSASSYALGGVWKLESVAKGLTLTADWASTGRIPKDYELYADGRHVATGLYERGNVDLAVERSVHRELGLRWVGSRKTDKASLNIYNTRYSNYIYLQDTGAVDAMSGKHIHESTATPARFSGWEWTGGKRLVAASALQPQSLDVEARISQVTAVQTLTGEALPRIAPKRMGADLIGKVNHWQWRLGADYNAAQNRIPTGQLAVGGYTLWNASLNYQQKSSLGRALWFAKLDNATNQLAYPATSILTQTALGRVPLPGRSLRLGVQLAF